MALGPAGLRLAALIIALTLGLAGQAHATSVADLGGFVPLGLNSQDQVVGDLVDSNANNLGAAVWANGTTTPLPVPAGADESDAFAINDAGRIVGLDHTTGGDVHALTWNGAGAPTQVGPISSFGPGSDFSQANGVDAAGDIAGTTVGPSTTSFQLTGFLDRGGALLTAGRADAGSGSSSVGAITADGHLLLGSVGSNYYLWSGASPNAAGIPLSFTPTRSGAVLFGTTIYGALIQNDLASDGTVVGYVNAGSVRNNYIRLPSGTVTPVTGLAAANAVNAKHVVAGTIATGNSADPVHAATWSPNGTVTDLNKLLPVNSGFDLFDTFAINDNGDIAGLAVHNGQQVGFLLKPGVQTENVEITQGIQNDTWDTPTMVNAPGYGTVSGGSYTGVPLVHDVPTVVRVYASDPSGQSAPATGATAELHAYFGVSGSLSELPGSPIAASPRNLGLGPALPSARLDPTGAYSFTLPAAWTRVPSLTLVADVNPRAGGPAACAGCSNVYALTGVNFTTTQPVTLRPFEIMYNYPNLGGHGFTTVRAPDLSSQFQAARDLLPLAANDLVVQPYPQAVLDLSVQVQAIVARWRTRFHTPLRKPDLTDCERLPGCSGALVSAEFSAVQRLITLAHSGHTYLVGFEPGNAGVTWPAEGFSILGPDHPPRPLTSLAHELLHLLGFAHASTACGGGSGGQVGVSWPPDELGYIEGVGLDRRPNSGGAGVYRIVAPGVGQPQFYDLMSYCTHGSDAVAWLSTVNWTKFITDHDAIDRPSSQAPRAENAAAGRISVDASLQPGGIATVEGASSTSGPMTRSQPSAFHLEVLGPHGRVLANVGVAPQRLTESPVLMFTATVPGAGATALELTAGGHVIAILRRPNPRPSVRLIVPRKGLRASHHKLLIRWRARGARHVRLTADIQYFASARQGWQTLAAGITSASYSVPVSMFAHARRVHLRVVISDGFSSDTATSRLVKLPVR